MTNLYLYLSNLRRIHDEEIRTQQFWYSSHFQTQIANFIIMIIIIIIDIIITIIIIIIIILRFIASGDCLVLYNMLNKIN